MNLNFFKKQGPKKGNKLNLAIAKTHRLSSRLVGMQITGGTFIGIGLSALQMAAGFIIVGRGMINGSFPVALLVAAIGCALALLVERLSIGGLSGIRVANSHIKQVEDAYYGLLRAEKRDPTDIEKEDYGRTRKAYVKQRGWSIVFACIGMALSAGIGDVFWHELFASLDGLGVVLSLGCALVISLTFLHTELYKFLIDGVLKEIITDLDLMKSAVAAEGQAMQVDMMVAAFDAIRDSEQARKPAQDKVEKTVVRGLASYADQVASIGGVMAGSVVVEALPAISHKPLALPAPKGKYMQNRDELRRIVMQNPTVSTRTIADHFSISRSTAGDWLAKVRSGN